MDNPQIRRAYENDVKEGMAFAGIEDLHAFRQVGRGHMLAWRRDLELRHNPKGALLSGATIRRKVPALSWLFDALCEANAVQGNAVDGVKQPWGGSQDGSTAAMATTNCAPCWWRPTPGPCRACAIG